MTSEASPYPQATSDWLNGMLNSENAGARRAFADIAPARELPGPVRAALRDAGLTVPSPGELDTRALRLVTDEARAIVLAGIGRARGRSEHVDRDDEEDDVIGGVSRCEILLRRLIARRRLDLGSLEQHDGYADAIAELEALATGLERLASERPDLAEHAPVI